MIDRVMRWFSPFGNQSAGHRALLQPVAAVAESEPQAGVTRRSTDGRQHVGRQGRAPSQGCCSTRGPRSSVSWAQMTMRASCQQKLFDMDSGELVDVKLPRGFSSTV